jgi:hypothetical protein
VNPEQLASYACTVLQFPTADPPLEIDLREPFPEVAAQRLRALGLGGRFAVLTAFNPRGRTVPAEQNRRRAVELRRRLSSLVGTLVPADGCSPDLLHREEGVAAALTEEQAREIACEFEQDAFFWFDGARFRIEGALEAGWSVPLPAPGSLSEGDGIFVPARDT